MVQIMGSLHLTHKDLEAFRSFLDFQEGKLADGLTHAFFSYDQERPITPLHGSGHFRLTKAIESIKDHVQKLNEEKGAELDPLKTLTEVNSDLKEYLGFLEESADELINRIDKSSLLFWNEPFREVATYFNELILHRIQDFFEVLRQLEESFLAYFAVCRKKKNLWLLFGKLFAPFASVLDGAIKRKLFRLQSRLSLYFQEFKARYAALLDLIHNSLIEERKALGYSVLNSLDEEKQEAILKLARWVFAWKLNQKKKYFKDSEMVEAVLRLKKPSAMVAFYLKEYIRALEVQLVEFSLLWKETSLLSLRDDLKLLQEDVKFVLFLAHSLSEIVPTSHLKSKFVKNSSPKKIFSKVFKRKPQESRQTREVSQLLQEIERLERAINQLLETVSLGPLEKDEEKLIGLKNQISDVLQEMGQPLSSKDQLLIRAHRLIELIDELDELGGTAGASRAYFTKVFNEALKADRKYQVLHEYPRFKDLYLTHKAFFPILDSNSHQERVKFLVGLEKDIDRWLKENSVQEHYEELLLDEAALQESFQAFLGLVQQQVCLASFDKEIFEQMVLEYRFYFNSLNHLLMKSQVDGKRLRQELVFIDHYLESAEKKLSAIQAADPQLHN